MSSQVSSGPGGNRLVVVMGPGGSRLVVVMGPEVDCNQNHSNNKEEYEEYVWNVFSKLTKMFLFVKW